MAVIAGRPFSDVARLAKKCVDDTSADGAAVIFYSADAVHHDLMFATDSMAARIDELQFTLGEGPSRDAFAAGEDGRHEMATRAAAASWPLLSSEVVGELAVHALIELPLLSGGEKMGVLEIYRRRAGHCTEHDMTMARAAACALAAAVRAELQAYAASVDDHDFGLSAGPFDPARHNVGIAIGVLAEQLELSVDDASARLRARAYADSVSVSGLAVDVIDGAPLFVGDER